MEDSSDKGLDELLRKVAATPDATGIGRPLRPGQVLAQRFEVQHQLGVGGMGQVFAVHDQRDGRQVAAKVLGRLSPSSIAEIKREFRAAAELASPHLVRLHELTSDEGRWFFTMELVEGTTLPGLLARTPATERPPVDLLRSVFRQLALGLMALHRAGVIHRDLKPSNFLIADADQRVVLLDFGLARTLADSDATVPAGTPIYMAPEQARGGALSEAVDWYAFGIVLFEALTGSLPVWIPPALSALAAAPADLAELCVQLLQIDPARRPAGEEILRRLGGATFSPRLGAPPGPDGTALIGRERELGDLERAYQQALAGRGAVALIHGPSGIGKSALAQHFVRDLRARGALVLTGRCRERESMSYKAADGIIDEVIALVDRLPEAEAQALLPPNIADLTVLFPALRAAKAVAGWPQPAATGSDRAMVRRHAITAFSALVARLRAKAPLVIWIDDLQWSDEESALLLGPLLTGATSVAVLFIGSYRTGSGERMPILEALARDGADGLRGAVDLALGPLTTQQAQDLARHWLGRADGDGAAAQQVARDAGGHPLFISELAHSARIGSPAPPTLSELVLARVGALPPQARSLLEIVAVSGAPLSRRVLRGAQDLDLAETDRAIDLLRGNRLASSQGPTDDDAVDVPHDRLRDIILQDLADPTRRLCHVRLARSLEAHARVKPEVLAGHYQAAGELSTAGGFWIAAADQALAALAFDHAAELYHRGLAQAQLAAEPRRLARVRMAEALTHAGKGSAAADIYLATAAECAPGDEVELRRRAAEQLLLCGHVERGLEVIEEVLGVIGMRKTRGGRAALPWLVAGRLRVRASGMRYRARPESDLSREELARLDVSWTVACSLGAMDFVRGAEFQTRHLLLAIRAGEPNRLLRALTLEAAFAATPGPGSERRSARFLALADRMVEDADDKAAASLLSLIRGIVAYLQGDLVHALEHCNQATSILRQRSVGAVWEMVTAHRFTIASLFFLGRLRDLTRVIPPLLSEAETNGNLYATIIFRSGYAAIAWLTRDAVDEARDQLGRARAEWKARSFQLSHYNMLVGEALLDLYAGDPAQALARIESQSKQIQRAQLHRISVLRVQLWYLRATAALRLADDLEARGQATLARERRQGAARLAALLRRDPLRRSAALADLVDAAIAGAAGESQRAAQGLQRAIEVFEVQGMKLFAAAARDRLGRLEGGTEGARLIAQAGAAFGEENVVDPLRMMALLAPALGPGPRAA